MHRHILVSLALATTALTAPVIAYPTSMAYQAGPTGDVTVRRREGPPKPVRYRSKGAQAKPKRRRNMVTVGRRVRRKHRRAA